jgi:hypothetical protein
MATPIRIDESELPLLLVTFEGAATDAEFEAYLAAMSALLERRMITATVLDARRASGAGAAQRRRQAEWMKEHAALMRQYSAGTAFVIESALVRGVLTAILWLQPMESPHIVVATLSVARVWAKQRLRERGVTV